MARYGTLGDYRFSDTEEAVKDIRGSKVYGIKDEKLGSIDDVIFDESTGAIVYVVVDTGGWLTSKKFIVPPQELRPSLQHEDDFLVDLTKPQIEAFPPYDGTALTSEERWAEYENRYRSKWVTGPVMHREATDRNVTPTTKQQVQSGAGTLAAEQPNVDGSITTVHADATMDVSPTGPSLRWDTFEDTLKRRREEVLESSINNLKRATGEAAAEREALPKRKAS
jgi:sporulation protein YlmC with PRC-barrel domain